MSGLRDICHGQHNGFYWLWSSDGRLSTLLEACPDIVLGRPVMVTDYHGAVPSPTPAETERGWRNLGHCAFNPALPKVEDLIWDDECEIYVLTEASEPEQRRFGFNSRAFTLRDPKEAVPFQETWDRRSITEQRERLHSLQETFWATMNDHRAESYIGAGVSAGFNFVTCREQSFEALLGALRAKSSR